MERTRWYAVKTLYRTRVVGRPSRRDQRYDGDATAVEERVVRFRARSFADAIRKAEREAGSYAALPPHRNRYGQRVVTRYLGDCDAFELFAAPGNSREVYSRLELEFLGAKHPVAHASMFEPFEPE